jgi:hypothetical protein
MQCFLFIFGGKIKMNWKLEENEKKMQKIHPVAIEENEKARARERKKNRYLIMKFIAYNENVASFFE